MSRAINDLNIVKKKKAAHFASAYYFSLFEIVFILSVVFLVTPGVSDGQRLM